jgi:RNA polymerase sigma factor (sigma-70 family)
MVMAHSVSQWIDGLRKGDERAAERLWTRYYRRVLGLARRRLGGWLASDAEDVAAVALHSLLRRVSLGDLPQLADRDDWWRLLMTITCRKASNHRRQAQCRKRGGGNAEPSVVYRERCVSDLEGCADGGQPPEVWASVSEALQRLLELLDDELRLIVLSKLDGYTNVEIAARVRRSVPTIERRLRLIREKWQQAGMYV